MSKRTRDIKRYTEQESDPSPPLGQRDIDKLFAAHRDSFASKYVSDQMEMNFTNFKECFVNDRPRNESPVNFIHGYYN